MRILMISGILTPREEKWNELRTAFNRQLPLARFCVATEHNCIDPYRFRKFILKTAAQYDTGEDLLMVGHSLGGVMACAIQPLLRRTRVIGITTIHSPHRLLFGICTWYFNAGAVSAPIISFQALHDSLVRWGTRHPKSIEHVQNHSNHVHDLFDFRENAELIADTTVRTFFTR